MTERPIANADSAPDADERLCDLLVARASSGLSRGEEIELTELLRSADPMDVAAFERTLALLDEALQDDSMIVAMEEELPLPPDLRERLVAQANAVASAGDATMSAHSFAGRTIETRTGNDRDAMITMTKMNTTLRARSRFGWIAAAASIFIAIAALLVRGGANETRSPDVVTQVNGAKDVVRLPFKPAADLMAGAGGEVVWSDALQRGYMRLTGLPANQPRDRQYQLWVVDKTRDEKPVDGGVFDVASATGDVVIPFETRLPVNAPAAFAITAERSGGVVVSAGPMLLVAAR